MMTKKPEVRAFVILLIGLLLYIGVNIYQSFSQIDLKDSIFLSLHTFFEIVAVSVAIGIAIQAWMVFPHTLSRHRLVLGSLFLVLGLFDIIHLLSYPGMPVFVGAQWDLLPSWLLLISRLSLAVGILIIYSLKDIEIRKSSRVFALSFVALFVTIVIGSLLLMSINQSMLIWEVGETHIFYNVIDFLILLFLITSIVLFIKKYQTTKNESYLLLVVALGFSFLSGLTFIFSFFHSIDEMHLVVGHLFKVASYFFFMKGIYSGTIEEPLIRQKQAQEAMQASEKRLETIVSTIPSGIVIADSNGLIVYANKAAEDIVGISNEKILSRKITESSWKIKTASGLDFPDGKNPIEYITKTQKPVKDVVFKIIKSNGGQLILSVNSAPIFNNQNKIVNTIHSLTDITEQIDNQHKINYLAYHDELTGLPNRNYLLDSLEQLLHEVRITGDTFALISINLNRFKNVNDSLGNDMGDLFLKTIAARLEEFTCDDTILARMVADEFIFIMPNRKDIKLLVQFANMIHRRLEEPMIANGFKFHITSSIGVTLYQNETDDVQHLIKQAQIAMHEAKKNGQSVMVYHPEMNAELYENIFLENDLRQAIDRNELLLHYQPQVNIETGEILGVEALIRWNHQKKGMISPGRFIPLAEETGLIIPIGNWVIEEACRQLRGWYDKGFPPIRISVNLSLRQLYQEDLVEILTKYLNKYRIQPQYLEIEITESMTMNVDRAITIFQSLKHLGVRISVDDFGTGYSSLSYLYSFPIDQLKIDQSFISNLFTEENNKLIVSTIISMGQNLGLELIAEGVETNEQAEFLRSYNCLGVQGYLVSRPLPPEELEAFIFEKYNQASSYK